MKVIVGLGNPAPKYAETRHNIGAMTVDRLCRQWGIRLERKNRYALLGSGRVEGNEVALAKPRSYMNLSGEPLAYLAARFRVKLRDILVVYDDMDLPLGVTRLRPEGGHGGHNGMRSIIDTLGSQDIPRLRLGVGRSPVEGSVRHVLGAFTAEEAPAVERLLARAAEAVACFVTDGVEAAMNRFNQTPSPDEDAEAGNESV